MEEEVLRVVEEPKLRGKLLASINSTFISLVPKKNNPRGFGDYKTIETFVMQLTK
jgi:hypothetical protein